MTSAQAVVSLASAVSSASCRRFPRAFPRNRFMPASVPAPGPEITMPELAVPHPRPRRPPPWSAPAGPVRPRPWSARPLPPRPPAAPTSALRQRFRPGHGPPQPGAGSPVLAGAPGERVLIESIGHEITVVDSGYGVDLVHYRPLIHHETRIHYAKI